METLTLKAGNHTIDKNDIVELIEWDMIVQGAVGRVDLKGRLIPTVTQSEFDIIKSWGVTPRLIKSIYGGTY
jgi:hypothetical protein